MVLFALAHHANDVGFCYPGIALIATEAGIRPRNVYKAIVKLEQAGLIRRAPGGGRGISNRYRLNMDGVSASQNGDAATTVSDRTNPDERPSNPDAGMTNGDAAARDTVTGASPESPSNSQEYSENGGRSPSGGSPATEPTSGEVPESGQFAQREDLERAIARREIFLEFKKGTPEALERYPREIEELRAKLAALESDSEDQIVGDG